MTRIWVESDQIDDCRVGLDSGLNRYHRTNDLEILLRSPERSDIAREESPSTGIRRCNNWVYVIVIVLSVSVSIATIIVLARRGTSSRSSNVFGIRAPRVETLVPNPPSESPTVSSIDKSPPTLKPSSLLLLTPSQEPSMTSSSRKPTNGQVIEPTLLEGFHTFPTSHSTDHPRPTHERTTEPYSETGSASLPFTPKPTTSNSVASWLDLNAVLEDSNVVLEAGERLSTGDFVNSPSGTFSVGIAESGAVVVLKTLRSRSIDSESEIVWKSNSGGNEKVNCFLQEDGNLVLRRRDDKSIAWTTNTSGYSGAKLLIDNRGELSLVLPSTKTKLWIAGMPRDIYHGPPEASLEFPIRGVFYQAWFPESWFTKGNPVKFDPSLGKYKLGYNDVEDAHAKSLEYIHADIVIASWFGPDTHSDRARLTNLMNKSRKKHIKWTIYHQHEKHKDPSVNELISHLDYIKKWFVWHDAWAHIEGKPVIFVNNEQNCEAVERWVAACKSKWYIVLKFFPRANNCSVQPNHWHLYDPTSARHHTPGVSYSISPGYWRADEVTPRLMRVEHNEWQGNINGMRSSNEPWQLVTSFNDWGEGTATESASQWKSPSGYGRYLDALHQVP
mmetsp:Transcript_29803/g.44049  ORF Transcript_29803/g.44049 Transcript_29803/m.44049 type:complete len:614 (-) Transcript_29803:400-2241(-)